MTYQVGWGHGVGAATVATVTELDAVLDGIQVGPGELPYAVSIVVPDGSDFPVMLEICLGHPARSFAYHVDADGTSTWGYEPDVPAGPEFAFDYGDVATDTWPESTRLTPEAAGEAAREFVAGGGAARRILPGTPTSSARNPGAETASRPSSATFCGVLKGLTLEVDFGLVVQTTV